MAKSKDKTSHPKKGLDKKALIEGIHSFTLDYWEFTYFFGLRTDPSLLLALGLR